MTRSLDGGSRGAAGRPAAVALAIVHHANQYLIADGYDNREGLDELVEGYAVALRLHERHGVPANLHLSGTLVEAIAWRCPWFLELVRELRARGVVGILGGTYSENVMPLFPAELNRRQLEEYLGLCRRHLGCEPEEVDVAWVPERVWNTDLLAPLLTSRDLPNGGYRLVLLDDRLIYPAGPAGPAGAPSPRARFDATGPYANAAASYPGGSRPLAPAGEPAGPPDGRGASDPDAFGACRIARSGGLALAPVSAGLRYWVPPRSPEHWRHLAETAERLSASGRDDVLMLYADDLEKTAGLGPWRSDSLARYDDFLGWVRSRADVAPTLLSTWLAEHPDLPEREVEPGAFFELARGWGAGEDYRGWWESVGWQPHRRHYDLALAAVREAERAGADADLTELAWKHLMACTYETAWHDPAGPADSPASALTPAPWARALASHARAVLPIADAARWLGRLASGAALPPAAELRDVDADGEDEVVLRSDRLAAVVAPAQGGRLVYLFARTAGTPAGGALVVGNPSDDWNWQEELNRYMDQPANHPGALSDVGCEHDRYAVAALGVVATGDDAGTAFVELVDAEPGSRLAGLRKRLRLAPGAPALVATYELPEAAADRGLAVVSCLSPDYLRLLREGRRGLVATGGELWRGARSGEVGVWVALDPEEGSRWGEPVAGAAGHGVSLRVEAGRRRLTLLVGAGEVDAATVRRLLRASRPAGEGADGGEPARELVEVLAR